MMKKLNILISAIIVFSVFSCDNREDPYSDYNNAPEVKVMRLTDTEGSVSISDSVKLGMDYQLKYFLTDEENLNLTIEKSIESDIVSLNNGSVIISGQTEGIHNITLKTEDSFGKRGEANIELYCFHNLRPVCKGVITKTAVLSDNEIEINLKESIDMDSRWGGKIVQYEYKIQNNYLARNYLPSIKYILESKGQKKITVRVQDNDGDWSDPQILYFTLN
jgi:hypothetical protein